MSAEKNSVGELWGETSLIFADHKLREHPKGAIGQDCATCKFYLDLLINLLQLNNPIIEVTRATGQHNRS